MATREQIYTALWALFVDDSRVKGKFVTTSRFALHFTEPAPEQMPAMFLKQDGESWVKAGKGIPAKRTLSCHLLLYLYSVAADPLPATLCNDVMDVVDDVIEQPGNPQNTQTLGGLVEHVYLEGEVEVWEALLQDVSVVVVPLTMVLP